MDVFTTMIIPYKREKCNMKYEKPDMAIIMFTEEDVIRTSTLTGSEGFIEEPSVGLDQFAPQN